MLFPQKNNGSADVDCVGRLEEIYLTLKSLNIDVMGLAFDGDAGYLNILKPIMKSFRRHFFHHIIKHYIIYFQIHLILP